MNYGIQESFMNEVLNDYFSGKSNYNVYVGLGLSNEGASVNTDDFIEPSEEGTGYSKQLFKCNTAVNGVTYNASDIIFDTATKDWTTNGRVIDKIGIFNKVITSSNGITQENYILWCVLPLNPVETVVAGDTVVLNANSIRLQLTNK